MNYDEILEAINAAETQETIIALKTTIALSCDDNEITDAEFHELRNICELCRPLLPTEHAQRENEREDLEQTYYQQIKI